MKKNILDLTIEEMKKECLKCGCFKCNLKGKNTPCAFGILGNLSSCHNQTLRDILNMFNIEIDID